MSRLRSSIYRRMARILLLGITGAWPGGCWAGHPSASASFEVHDRPENPRPDLHVVKHPGSKALSDWSTRCQQQGAGGQEQCTSHPGWSAIRIAGQGFAHAFRGAFEHVIQAVVVFDMKVELLDAKHHLELARFSTLPSRCAMDSSVYGSPHQPDTAECCEKVIHSDAKHCCAIRKIEGKC